MQYDGRLAPLNYYAALSITLKMIRPIIKEQLDNCQFANLNNYDKNTNTFRISKYCKPSYDINKCYLLRLPINIVNNKDSVLATNWNSGSAPSNQYLKVYVSKSLGTMIYVDSIGYDFETKQDLSTMWSGWLNTTELTQISIL